LRFPYGQEVIDSALLTGSAISYRFRRDDKGWRVFVSTVCQAPPLITSRLAGAIGVDINADHLAIAEIDRFGNLVGTKKIGCVTYGKSIERRQAVIGEAVKQVVDMAEAARKPVVIEKLDFDKRKAELEKEPAARARMLSSLAYSQVQQMLRAACFRAGVEVIGVNPAYTSTIGAVNFAQRYGISVHQGAALAIARRGLGFSESPTAPIGIVPVGNGGHVTFPLPVRNRGKHVWMFWSSGACSAHPVGRPAGRSRAFAAESRIGRYLDVAGGTPARQSFAILFGERYR
jgi:IS605 OrfB family transposase